MITRFSKYSLPNFVCVGNTVFVFRNYLNYSVLLFTTENILKKLIDIQNFLCLIDTLAMLLRLCVHHFNTVSNVMLCIHFLTSEKYTK